MDPEDTCEYVRVQVYGSGSEQADSSSQHPVPSTGQAKMSCLKKFHNWLLVPATEESFGFVDCVFTIIPAFFYALDIFLDLYYVVKYLDEFIQKTDKMYILWLTTFFMVLSHLTVCVASHKDYEKKCSRGPAFFRKALVIPYYILMFFWGLVFWYVEIFQVGRKAQRTKDRDDLKNLHQLQRRTSCLHLHETFLDAAPQLVLRLYIMMLYSEECNMYKIIAIYSMVSVGLSMFKYIKSVRNTCDEGRISILGQGVRVMWRAGMMGARFIALVAGFITNTFMMLVILGIHFLFAYYWVVKDQPVGTSWQDHNKHFLNLLFTIINVFDFFHIKDIMPVGKMLMYYILVMMENIIILGSFYTANFTSICLSKPLVIWWLFTPCAISGVVCLFIYYWWFHPAMSATPFQNLVIEIPEQPRSDPSSLSGGVEMASPEADSADSHLVHQAPSIDKGNSNSSPSDLGSNTETNQTGIRKYLLPPVQRLRGGGETRKRKLLLKNN